MVAIALALLTVALLYVASARMLASRAFGALAVVLFVATPLLWTQFEHDPRSLLPLVAVSGWLFAFSQFEAGRGFSWIVVAAVSLGAGLYTTPAAAVMMPVYALITMAALVREDRASLRLLTVFALTCAVSALPFAWMLFGPEDRLRLTVKGLRLYDADRFNILQGIKEMVSWVGLTARSEVYYNYFNPAFLFLTGGVLLPPLVLLLPIGLYQLLVKATPVARVLLLGFCAAPVAAALLAEQPIPRRILFITPFAAIVSVYGVQRVVSWFQRFARSSAEATNANGPLAD
jgi:hypothetical protein